MVRRLMGLTFIFVSLAATLAQSDSALADRGSRSRAVSMAGSTGLLSQEPVWLSEPAGTITQGDFGDFAGVAGDVNNDGFADVFVDGAMSSSKGFEVFVYHGSSKGLPTTPSRRISRPRLGGDIQQAAPAGDVNNDGFDDFVIATRSSVFLYLGSASGLRPAPAWTAGQLSEVKALAGADINGDGFSDVLVGSEVLSDDEFSGIPQVRVFRGSSTGLSTAMAWTPTLGDKVGRAIANAGDIDKDGFEDVLFSSAGSGNDDALLFRGSASGLETTYSWIQDDNTAMAAAAGDVNNDGFPDVAVGYDNSGRGEVRVFLGSATGLASTAAVTIPPRQEYEGFGLSVASAGDVNKDSFDDIIVGAQYFTKSTRPGSPRQEGAAYVFLGTASGLSPTVAWQGAAPLPKGNNNAYFGKLVSTAGDVNGDGFSEVLVATSRYDSGILGKDSSAGEMGSVFVFGTGTRFLFLGVSVSPGEKSLPKPRLRESCVVLPPIKAELSSRQRKAAENLLMKAGLSRQKAQAALKDIRPRYKVSASRKEVAQGILKNQLSISSLDRQICLPASFFSLNSYCYDFKLSYSIDLVVGKPPIEIGSTKKSPEATFSI